LEAADREGLGFEASGREGLGFEVSGALEATGRDGAGLSGIPGGTDFDGPRAAAFDGSGFGRSDSACACLARKMAARHSSCPLLAPAAGERAATGEEGGPESLCFAFSSAARHSSFCIGALCGVRSAAEGADTAFDVRGGTDGGGLESASLCLARSMAARQASPLGSDPPVDLGF
jgi:hypothetical protein